MKKFLVSIAVLVLNAPAADARFIVSQSYQELFDKSDLVVIARPTANTYDTKEKSSIPGMFSIDGNGKTIADQAIGVETPFNILVILKGKIPTKQFTLHHYREVKRTMQNGPGLLFFDLSDKMEHSYLLFLIREQDGRYAPTAGQTDPDYNSVGELTMVPRH